MSVTPTPTPARPTTGPSLLRRGHQAWVEGWLTGLSMDYVLTSGLICGRPLRQRGLRPPGVIRGGRDGSMPAVQEKRDGGRVLWLRTVHRYVLCWDVLCKNHTTLGHGKKKMCSGFPTYSIFMPRPGSF